MRIQFCHSNIPPGQETINTIFYGKGGGMESIELKMAILTGLVGGSIMVLAEGVVLYQKLTKYQAHLRGLYHAKRFFRLTGEICIITFVVLIQPLIVSILVISALDRFTPQFSVHVMAELTTR
jgi:hypothetical protein